MLKFISAAILFLALAIVALGQPKPAPAQTQFQKLQQEYNQKLQEYYRPFQNAKTPEEAAKIKLDPAKDPAPTYLVRFRALALKGGTSPEAFQAWMMVRQIADQKSDAKASDEAVEAMLTKFSNSPLLAQLASSLPYAYFWLQPAEREPRINALLARIERASKLDAVQSAALYARAQLASNNGRGDAATAAALYREVASKYPNTEPGKRAKNDVFEMENLVPGKEAPDFAATDQDGVKFKLSDYRGKVVVLDFWGFW